MQFTDGEAGYLLAAAPGERPRKITWRHRSVRTLIRYGSGEGRLAGLRQRHDHKDIPSQGV